MNLKHLGVELCLPMCSCRGGNLNTASAAGRRRWVIRKIIWSPVPGTTITTVKLWLPLIFIMGFYSSTCCSLLHCHSAALLSLWRQHFPLISQFFFSFLLVFLNLKPHFSVCEHFVAIPLNVPSINISYQTTSLLLTPPWKWSSTGATGNKWEQGANMQSL